MKRLTRKLASFLVLCLLISLLPVSASAKSLTYTDEYGAWTYQVEMDGSVTILKCDVAKKNIVIPAVIDGSPVKKLGKHLFQNNDTITAVVIPHGVEEMEKMVFFNCDKLEYVEIPNSMQTIGDKAFSKCASLGDLYIPSSVTSLGKKVFEDSPNLDVHCSMHSWMAEYLNENQSAVASYTLIQVTYQDPGPEILAGVGADSSGATKEGKLVTYTFGGTESGKPRFTVVVADSMPELDLMHYVVKLPNGENKLNHQEEVEALMANRFKLVSVTRYDGKTFDFSKQAVSLCVEPYLYNYLDEDGAEQTDVLYTIGIDAADYAGFPSLLEFNSHNELLTYETADAGVRESVEKNGDTYYTYQTKSTQSTRYMATNGEEVVTYSEKAASIHRFGVQGACVSITIRVNENTFPNASPFGNGEKKIETYDPDTQTAIAASSTEYTRANGTTERLNSTYEKKTDGVIVEKRLFDAQYDPSGRLLEQSHKEEISAPETAEGTYNVTTQSYDKYNAYTVNKEEVTWDEAEDPETILTQVQVKEWDRLVYHENVVRADSVQDATDKVSDHFPNEPDEHTSDVSYRYVDTVEARQETGTQVNLNTGDETDINQKTKTETYKNYTYLGNTGKYVGWDWSWTYVYEEDRCTLTEYTVTEYQYTAEGNTWTKTEAKAVVNDAASGSTLDFKDTSIDINSVPGFNELRDDYTISGEVFLFKTEETGMDNWTSFDPFVEVEDILLGLSEVTVPDTSASNGIEKTDGEQGTETVLVQNTVKKEMFDLAESVAKDCREPEDFFEETLKDADVVPDGTELLKATEEILEGAELPESNVEETVEHSHDANGTSVTIIDGAAPEQPASVADSIHEPSEENLSHTSS